MLELRHLRYLVAVADEGHVTRAAARLGIQQPPLSQQIRAMEEMVGTLLFHRLPRGMEPTAAGRALAEKARLILRDVDLAVEVARRAGRGEEGGLAVGFTSSAAFHPVVVDAVREMREAAPGVTLMLEEADTGALLTAVETERLDVAFVRSAGERGSLAVTTLLEEEMLAAVPERHPLAARRMVPLAALADEPFVLYRRPTGPGLYDGIIAACRAAGFSPRVEQEATRLVSTLSLVAAGLGVSIIPQSMARLETAGVAYLRLGRSASLAAPLALAHRRGVVGGPLARFLAVVQRRAREAEGRP